MARVQLSAHDPSAQQQATSKSGASTGQVDLSCSMLQRWRKDLLTFTENWLDLEILRAQ